MVHARTAGKPGPAARPSGPASSPRDVDRLREHIAELLLEAARFVLLARAEPVFADPAREMLLVADALGMAMDVALFTPSSSGATALDRVARQRRGMGTDESATLNTLRRMQFRLLRVEAVGPEIARLRDLATTCLPAEPRRSTRPGLQSPAASCALADAGC